MSNRTKFYLLAGTVVMDMVYAATSPVIQIYFMRLISSDILAMANILTTALAAIVNATVSSKKLKDIYRKYFACIIITDVVCFALISFESVVMPEVRFLGLAILNAVSSTIWFAVINDAVNHRIEGDALTKWNSVSKSVNLTAALLGSVIAILFTNMNIEYCIAAQCAASFIMGFTDWKAYKDIRY